MAKEKKNGTRGEDHVAIVTYANGTAVRLPSAVAEFALLLEDSKHKGDASFAKLIERARTAKGEDREGYRAEFIRLAESAEVYSAESKSVL